MKKNLLLAIAALITAWSTMTAQHLPGKDLALVEGPLSYQATDLINIHIAGTGDTEYDRLELSSGTLTPNGATLNVFPCYASEPGDRFVIFKAPTIDGEFSNPSLIDVGGNFFILSYEKDIDDNDLVVLTAVTKLFGLYITTPGSSMVETDYNYRLNVVAEPEAGGNVDPIQANYEVCDVMPIQATANPGYAFTHWTEEGGAIIDDTEESETTATMPARDVTITANFCELPNAPVANEANYISTNTFTANWEEVPDITYYELQVALNSDFNPILIAYRMSYDILNQVVGGLSPTTTYYYRVSSTNDCGTSEYSNMVSVYTAAYPFTTCGDNITFSYRGSTVTYGTIERGGLCWLDRNLGADPMPFVPADDATGNTDTRLYGDLIQWGRLDDGHQDRTSTTTSTLSTTDDPGHGNFITVSLNPRDWLSPQNDNLWQGEEGINNPCPDNWRVPTETELDAERESWGSNNSAGAYGSTLKWPVGGFRDYDGTLDFKGTSGEVWSSSVSGTSARALYSAV